MIEFCNWVSELIKGLGYSVIGFLIGYNFCRMRRSVERIEEAIVTKGERAGDDDNVVVRRERSSSFSDWQGRTIGIVLLLLAIFTVAQSIYFAQEQNKSAEEQARITACQAEYNRDFARAVTVRGEYADEDRNALFRMITAAINTSLTPAQRQKAVQDWISNTQKNDVLRQQNPLPNLADRNCEEK